MKLIGFLVYLFLVLSCLPVNALTYLIYKEIPASEVWFKPSDEPNSKWRNNVYKIDSDFSYVGVDHKFDDQPDLYVVTKVKNGLIAVKKTILISNSSSITGKTNEIEYKVVGQKRKDVNTVISNNNEPATTTPEKVYVPQLKNIKIPTHIKEMMSQQLQTLRRGGVNLLNISPWLSTTDVIDPSVKKTDGILINTNTGLSKFSGSYIRAGYIYS